MGRNSFDFAVEIDFQGQCGSVKYGAAVLTIANMTLNFTGNFGRQPSFEIFAD